MLVKAQRIQVTGQHRLRVWFTDGSVGERDFAGEPSRGGPMARPLLDPDFFAQVFLDYDAPTLPNGYDMAPWALHKDMEQEGLLRRAKPV